MTTEPATIALSLDIDAYYAYNRPRLLKSSMEKSEELEDEHP